MFTEDGENQMKTMPRWIRESHRWDKTKSMNLRLYLWRKVDAGDLHRLPSFATSSEE